MIMELGVCLRALLLGGAPVQESSSTSAYPIPLNRAVVNQRVPPSGKQRPSPPAPVSPSDLSDPPRIDHQAREVGARLQP